MRVRPQDKVRVSFKRDGIKREEAKDIMRSVHFKEKWPIKAFTGFSAIYAFHKRDLPKVVATARLMGKSVSFMRVEKFLPDRNRNGNGMWVNWDINELLEEAK